MPILFNSILNQFGLAAEDTILLRHQDKRAGTLLTPYELWRDDLSAFDLYQSCQSIENRPKFTRAKNWASFVATPDGATMFVGLYAARYKGTLPADIPQPHTKEILLAGSCDTYELLADKRFADFAGTLFIKWGDGTRAWVQRAENQIK